LIFFFVLISAAATQNPNCTPDAAAASKQCYLTFLQNFGFSDIPAYDDFQTALHTTLYSLGGQGIQSMCNWFQTLDSCLIPVIGGCNNTVGCQKILGVDTKNGEEYIMFYALQKFQCNEGYNFLMNNYYCLESVEQHHDDEVQVCKDNLTQSIQNNSFNCSYMADFINCITNLYQKYCGTPAGGYICTSLSRQIETAMPDCTGTTPQCASYNKVAFFHNLNYKRFVPRMKFLQHHLRKLYF